MFSEKDYLPKDWECFLGDAIQNNWFGNLMLNVKMEYGNSIVYPPYSEIFTAFNLCSPNNLKVVILGQDPYHGHGQAHGLAFSVRQGIAFPPSLRNIFKELGRDFGCEWQGTGDLSSWASQGVLLLNSSLTVKANLPGSHHSLGWQKFTNLVVTQISEKMEGVVFLLWGKEAADKLSMINQARHLVLLAPHPSPLSAHRGFIGCGHFSKANKYLKERGVSPVIWTST